MSCPDDERLARVRFSRAAEPGVATICDQVADHGALAAMASFEEKAARRDDDLAWVARLRTVDPDRELERAQRLGIRFVVPGDAEWPSSLGDLRHPEPLHGRGGVPIGLWVRGPLRLDALADSVAVVGSRSATTYGTSVAHDLSAVLARSGRPVVSGAAYGIDQAAHRGAIAAGGATVAVLACGVDRAYPAEHAPLITHIGETGAVVSEAAPGCSPMRVRFLARNRLIAALTAGTVLVEAALRSGALNTATWAVGLHRPLMGVPGPVTSAASGGVHERIRVGAATLVTSGHEVLELVAKAGEHLVEVPRGPSTLRDRLKGDQSRVLEAVPVSRGVPVESIARIAGVSAATADMHLQFLAVEGLVTTTGGGWVQTALARSGA
ncbi:DNA-protecting protein DprA [Nocardioides gansuensis]|uniref:DNA-protecting protein DprA n=1 Tax=Nocardioides gansuensis TaxID=2138300 RepID=A0A2T8FAE7_9ACTN|nr:DNA-processing protein DprA [Nocardioides gansuensis]PVG82663.1 DNA-protecting protein DprA [Nocardioides gansuensis]